MPTHFRFNSTTDEKRLLLVKRTPAQKSFIQLNEIFNNFINGNNTNADAIRKKSFDPQSIGLVNEFGKSTATENSESQDQIKGHLKEVADKIQKAVDNAAMTVEN